jgi:hypothetical protein
MEQDFISLMRNISPINFHFVDGKPVLKNFDHHKALQCQINQDKLEFAWLVYRETLNNV